jgi:hypothetical protein
MYSNIIVEGGEYPIAGWKKMAGNVVSLLQIAFLAVIFGGDYVRPYITFIPPHILELIERKKWAFAVGTYFGGTFINSSLRTSGAFEIFVNNKLVNYRLF